MDYSQAETRTSTQISPMVQPEQDSLFWHLGSLQLLTYYVPTMKRLREENVNMQISDTRNNTCRIMELAKARLLELNSQNADILSWFCSTEFSEDMVLALLVQAAAEKIADNQLIYARKLLNLCNGSASKTGNTVQRVVYYFAEALQERIDQQWGLISTEKLEGRKRQTVDEELNMISLEPAVVECQQELPFCLETQFATTESILEAVKSAKRVHLIDFEIGNGSQWTLIMQAFSVRSQCPLELLKITAVGTCKKIMEKTGQWLSSFAETINLPFSFQIIVSDLKELNGDLFELEANEVVAVDFPYRLWSMLVWPNHLEALIRVIKNLRPCVMVVKEIEVRTNSPIFLERFNETLLFVSAIFDSTKACMEHHVLYRKLAEEVYSWNMIRNVIAADDIERVKRHEKVAFWRSLFARFGIVETDLSQSALYTANLLKSSDRFTSCSVEMDGKCLIFGWNGTPLQSVSAWKFLSN